LKTPRLRSPLHSAAGPWKSRTAAAGRLTAESQAGAPATAEASARLDGSVEFGSVFAALGLKARPRLQSFPPRRFFFAYPEDSRARSVHGLMKRHLLALDSVSLEAKVPCFEITAVANDHVEQTFAVTLARDTIRITGEALAATFANVA
jgi:hypothetical protein